MPYWIFQGNPDKFDVDKYIGENKYVYLSVSRPSQQIAIGDPCFVWRAKGSKNAVSGIIAFGNVIEGCCQRQNVKNREWLYSSSSASPNPSEIHAGVRIDEVRLTPQDGMLKSSELQLDPDLSKMQIIRVRQGSNFKISTEHFSKLRALWQMDDNENGPINVSEGRVLQKLHNSRERDATIVKQKKQAFIKQNGYFSCEICKEVLQDKYGPMAEQVIEVHHTKPVHLMKPGDQTSLQDLVLLCPNCHRVIHSGEAVKNYEELKKRFPDPPRHSTRVPLL
jgi:hypothetical protein